MMIFKCTSLVLLLLLLFMVLCGCQSHTELSQLAIITGIGLDRAEGGGYRLTVELAHQQTSNEPGEGVTYTVEGDSLEALEAALRLRLDKEPNWSNAVSLVVGAALAEQGADTLLTQMYQDFRFNPGLLLILAGGSAEEALNAKFGEGEYVAQGLAEALNRQALLTDSKALTLADYLQQRLSGQEAVALPLLMIEAERLVLAGSALVGAAEIPALYAYE